MDIDLSILDEIGGKNPPKKANKPISSSNALTLEKQSLEQQQKIKFYYDIIEEYQNNIKKSQFLRAEINKDIKENKDYKDILLKAIECISKMTGDKLFYIQNEAALKENTPRKPQDIVINNKTQENLESY